MARNYILGSSIDALLARDILGSDWGIIPVCPSRFFGSKCLIDDCIEHNTFIDDYLSQFGNIKIDFNNDCFSFGGELIKNSTLKHQYYNRIYRHSETIQHLNNVSLDIGHLYYVNIGGNKIYNHLLKKYKQFFLSFSIKQIKDHKIYTTDDQILEYNKILNTLPDAMFSKYFDIENNQSYDVTIIECQFDNNLEQHRVIYVIDNHIPFHKVVDKGEFYSVFMMDKINSKPIVFESVLENLNIKNVFYVPQFYNEFTLYKNKEDIYALGRHARHDDAFTIATSILNLLGSSWTK